MQDTTRTNAGTVKQTAMISTVTSTSTNFTTIEGQSEHNCNYEFN